MGFNIALSGLNATAEAIDVTSNNIANSQTVGYKAGEYVFADQFFRAQDPQSKDRSGMGTYRMAIRRDQNYGTVTGTQNPLDLALTGPGMFVLAKTATGNVPNETPNVFQYTRNGQFAVDSQSRIVNENGMLLVGYPADTQGNISQGSFSVLTMDQSPLPAKASSASTINLNLNNTGNPINTPFDPSQTVTYTQSTSQTVYDSAGNQHTLSQYYAKANPATLYFYPQDASGTNFAFNPTQDVSDLAQRFGVGQNVTSVPSGIAQDANFSIATTASPPTGATPASVEYLSGATIVPFPANQSSTYQMTLNDGSKMLVTKQSFTDNTTDPVNPKTYTRYAFSADRYKVYSTVDGINVNRVIDTSSQVGLNFSPAGVVTLSQNKVAGKDAGTVSAVESTFIDGTPAGTASATESGFVDGRPVGIATVVGSFTPGVAAGTATVSWQFTEGTNLGTATAIEGSFLSGPPATDKVTFTPMAIGDSVTVNGLTYTATSAITNPDQVAAKFATAGLTTAAGTGSDADGAYAGSWDSAKYDPSLATSSFNSADLSVTAAGSYSSPINASPLSHATLTAATTAITFGAMAIGDSVTVNGLTYTATSALTADQAASKFNTSGLTAALADTNHTNYTGTWDATYSSTATSTSDGTGVLTLTAATAGAGQSAAVVSAVPLAAIAATEAITFGPMAIGDSVIVNGLTYTATAAMTADQAALAFSTDGLTAAAADTHHTNYTGTWGATYISAANTNGSGVLTLTAATAGNGAAATSVTAHQATATTASDTITFGAMAIGDSVTVNGLTYTATSAITNPDQVAAKFNTAGLITAAGTGSDADGTYSGSWDATYSSTATTNGSGVLTLTAATAGAGQTAAAVSKTGTTTVSGSFTQGIDAGTVTATESGFVQGTSVALTATPQILASATDTVTFSQMAPGDSVTMAGLTFTNNTADTITSNQVALKFTAAAIAANSGLNTNGYSGTFDTTNFTAASATSGVGLNEIVISSVAQGATAQNLAAGSVIAHQMHSNQTVTAVSVGGALAGSAPAGTYTLGSVSMTDGVSGDATPAMLPIGGIAGVYTVNLSGGTGTGAQAIINYSGSGIITGITLNGGQNYSIGDVLNISAGSLGAGSTGFSLAALTAPQVVTGTYMTLSSGVGPALRSSQPIQDGVVGQTQNFDFANGVSMSINNSGSVIDTITTIANSFNNKTITVSNQPTGTMAFVAGKNIDSLSRDQFGKPAYNTRTTISTSVGSGTLKNMLSINIDSTNMTAYSSAAQTYDNSTDGNPMAQLTAYSIDNAGKLVANYDNGVTVVKGQLAIANFNNTEGLIPVGSNSFERSGTDGMGSGPVIYGTANSGNLGAIRAKAVESSNVDLTAELVKLMTLQRLYSANSQAVKIEAATIVDDAIRLGQ